MFLRKRKGWSQQQRRGLVLAGCALLGGLTARAEQPARPSLQLPLREMGFPGYPLSLLHAGASMATVNVLDSTHVLFTYSLRSLVPRLPGDDANDTDRQVGAVLVELPSGKVLARTKWHLHDHARYLWSAGRGVLVLRTGSELSLLAPLQALANGEEPFRRFALPHRPGQPVLVWGSPDGRVLTVEMEQQLAPSMGDPEEDGTHRRRHYTLEFFRLDLGASQKEPIHLEGAGAVGSPVAMKLAMDGDGYLWAEDNERGKWNVSFNEFGGKQQKLAPVISSCRPRLDLLSRSQFLVETCRGSDQQPMLASFGFDGHENWEEPFGESLQPPTLALSPESGRFALSRLVASSTGAPINGMGNDDPISQEIRVYQTESGDMLLRVQCAPAVRSAENFDLAPDGKTLAVLGPETLDIYRLPELSAKDKRELADAQTMTPPLGNGPVLLNRIARPVEAPVQQASSEASPAAAAAPSNQVPSPVAAADAAPVSASKAAETVASTSALAEGEAPAPVRKRPTLLNPGEKAEFRDKSVEPR